MRTTRHAKQKQKQKQNKKTITQKKLLHRLTLTWPHFDGDDGTGGAGRCGVVVVR